MLRLLTIDNTSGQIVGIIKDVTNITGTTFLPRGLVRVAFDDLDGRGGFVTFDATRQSVKVGI